MPNSYYDNQDAGQRFLAGETARGSDVDAKFDAVEAGFDTLPEPNDIKAATVNFSADSGTANNYVLTSTQNYTAYTTGQQVRFIAGNANTGSAVINLDGLGNKSVLRQDGSALRSGDIPTGGMIAATYNGTAFLLDTSTAKMINDAETGAATATAQATTATNQAQIATAQASTATTQAGIATTKAADAANSEVVATDQADIATTQAGIATVQANTATTQAGIATTQAGIATTKASEASDSATTAAEQAGIATTKAGDANTSAGAASTSAALAQEWATKTDAEVVTGQGYGAKKYAEDAAISAAEAALFDPSSYLPADAIVYIKWSAASIYITQTMTGTITNYDSLTDYTVSAALGTVSITGDTLTYTAPATAGTETLTINGLTGRTLQFDIQPTGIVTPTLASPSNGAIYQGGSVGLVASTYATAPAGFEAHVSSDWQVATDAGFANIVAQSLNDTTNLESWTADGLVESTLYYWRVRYKSATLVSAWMTTAQFTTADTFVGVIGIAGQKGFGAGVYPGSDLATAGLSEMAGTTDPAHDNFGNYQHSNGSIMVFVPKFYYRVGNAAAPQYATYGANSIEIAGINQFSDTASANAAGYVLHRAFIDGGSEKHGFFIDKYLSSNDGSGNAVSVKNGVPLSLTTTTTYTRTDGLTGCTGILADSVVLGRARGSQYNQSSAFMFGALAILSLAHGQMATGTAACAWYDASGTTNFPKGCNNALSDVNDSGVTFTTAGDAGTADKPLAGSGVPFAKTTHNGQSCGVADLNGSLYDCALGITAPGTSATSTTALSDDTIYVLKESVALASLTAGWDTGTDAWGNTTHLNTLYDSVTSPHALGSTTGSVYWGNGSNQAIDGVGSGVAWSAAGFIPKDNNATSATGTNQFGNDYLSRYNRHNMLPLVGGYWAYAAGAGVFCRYLFNYRSFAYNVAAPRASAYLQ